MLRTRPSRTVAVAPVVGMLAVGMALSAPTAAQAATYEAVSTEVTEAMVYSAGARLTIQKIAPGEIEPGDDYTWDATNHVWVGEGAGTVVFNDAVYNKTSDGPGGYGAEINVSGKLVYGYNLNPSGLNGEYRITFSLDDEAGDFPGSGATLEDATIRTSPEEVTTEAEGDGNTAIVYTQGQVTLSYIDVGIGTATTGTSTAAETLETADLRMRPLAEPEDSYGNNLAMPVVWAEDGYTVPLRGVMDDPLIEDDGPSIEGKVVKTSSGCLAALQKDQYNTWQADNVVGDGDTHVTSIDWGDNLESKDWPNTGRVRIETALYATVNEPMTQYTMCYVSGQRTTEVWGVQVTGPDPTAGGGSGGGGGGSAPAPAPVSTVQTPADQDGQPEVTNPQLTPQAASALFVQKAKIKALKSGKYPVGTTIVLAKKRVKTSAGVTVRWRATVRSQDNCMVKIRKGDGKATVKLIKPGRCRIIAWAPPASPDWTAFRATRTYRVVNAR